MWWLVVCLVLSWSCEISAVKSVDDPVSCRDENNNAVDWYILYKAPSDPKFQHLTGLEYIYMYREFTSAKKLRGSKYINDPNGVLANTLRPMLGSVRNMVYDSFSERVRSVCKNCPMTQNGFFLVTATDKQEPKTFGFLSYSDQPPGSFANGKKFGHSKGVVLGDSGTKTALWLTHSTPQFPFRRDQNNFWPPTGNKNAQTFMCVSLDWTELETVGKHLQHIHALTYDHDLPNNFPDELKKAANWETAAAPTNLQVLKDNRRWKLKIRAKQNGITAEVGDLYVQLATDLKSDVDAQTWGCQTNRDQSCVTTTYKVMNVKNIHISELGQWAPKHDHSKWAMTTADNNPLTCICDMNRAVPQYKRWGGALCIEDRSVHGFFNGFISRPTVCGEEPSTECSDSEEDSEIESLSDSDQQKMEL